ncbi:MarR family winged helix-turn-helix transcriptional regulator [Nocardia thailandica]|uniref:MarR family winged helix-turn-helix transcriptional regulator n=1 Tax=Nocardia thailandica TaxID=257275 RepID=A0ABW6PX99_9NOCA
MSRRAADRGASAIGAALYGLATRATRRLPRDMSLTSAATLATLERTGPRRITELAAVAGITQPAMTALVRVMEESGLVERRGDAADRRVTLVCLTEAGASCVHARRAAGVEAFERLIGELTGAEITALEAALPALHHLAELADRDREGRAR